MSKTPEHQPGAGWDPLKDEPQERGPGPRLIVAGLALLAVAVFVGQNRERVETKFLFFSGEPRLWTVIVVSALLGALLGQAIPMIRRRRKTKQAKQAKQEPTSEKDKK